MATPITWRTIAGPNFNNSGLGTAVQAFGSAGEGFSRFGGEMLENQGRADNQYTNQEIAEALRTGKVNPNLNPRADSARVQDALLGLQTGQSDLETAKVGRELTIQDTLLGKENTSDKQYENSEAFRTLEADSIKSEINRRKAQTANEQADTKLRGKEFEITAEQFKITKAAREGRDLINDFQDSQTERFANDIIKAEYPDVAQVTEAQFTDIMTRATAKSLGVEGRSAARGEFQRLKLPEEAWTNSGYGEQDEQAKAIQTALSTERIKRQEIARENGQEAEYLAGQGNYSMMGWENGNVVPINNPSHAKAQKEAVDNAAKGIGVLIANGMNADKWSDDEKATVELVRGLFPTSTLFSQIVKSFVIGGKLSEAELRQAAGEGAQALLERAKIEANPTYGTLRDNPRADANAIINGTSAGGPNAPLTTADVLARMQAR